VPVAHLEVLVEEPSMEQALRILLPKLVGDLSFEVYPFQCKDELLAELPKRLAGYASWLPEDHRIVILVDRDDDDCVALKARLEEMAAHAGLVSKSQAPGRYQILNRIVCEELEAWFFGDWDAVTAAYQRVPNIANKAAYRESDEIKGGTWEAFERVLKQGGYFKSGLRKLEAASAVAAELDPDRNRSPSFCALRDALRALVSHE